MKIALYQRMRQFVPALLLVTVIVAASALELAAQDPARMVQSRARFSFRRWLRYEFASSKTFSYGNSQVREGKRVIGYEPSWLIYDSLYLDYPFELLSDLVVGEYDVNPRNGSPRGDSSHTAFKKKNIVQVASTINTDLNVLLAVTDYGDSGYRKKFLDEISKKNLINMLDQSLGEINLDMGHEDGRYGVGVMMDFPNVAWTQRGEYLEFLRRLKRSLNDEAQNKSCLLYVVLPYRDPYRIFQRDSVYTQALREVADALILRVHVFDEPMDGPHGPMLPLYPANKSKRLSMDSVITYMTEKAKIPPEELIVEFGYYGRQYGPDSTLSPLRPLLPLAELMNTVETVRRVDTAALTFYKTAQDTLSFYYEDTTSFNIKYRWLNERKLGGVGLYGLGYAHGMDDTRMQEGLWELIAIHFTEPPPRLFFPAIGFLLIFVGSGIILSVILSWQVRYALRERMRSFWFYFSFLLVLILTAWLCIMPLSVIPVLVKIIAIVILLIFPLGRKAVKMAMKARGKV